MSTNEEVFVRRFVEMFNKLDMSIANEIFAPHFKAHLPAAPIVADLSEFKSFMMGIYDGLPDLMLEIEDTMSSIDRLFLRGTFTGTHKYKFLGIDPSGHEIVIPVMYNFRLDNGVIVENWTQMDLLGAISQISGGSSLSGGDCQ